MTPDIINRTIITVEGTGRFPLKALWAEKCYPLTYQDAEKVETVYAQDSEPRQVSLVRHTLTWEFVRPSNEIWAIYGWSVVDVRDIEGNALRVVNVSPVKP